MRKLKLCTSSGSMNNIHNIMSSIVNTKTADDRVVLHVPNKARTLPLSLNQRRYEESIRSPLNSIIVGVGPAGTGKTYIPCSIAAEMLIKKKIKKILITRPAVNVDESHGFLPGDIESKMMPYMKPIYDCLNKSGVSNDLIRSYIKNGIIEICPLSYIRGRTFSDCFLLADETQNCTVNHVKTLLTRIGENCKVVMTGDTSQSDLPTPVNGLSDLIERIDIQIADSLDDAFAENAYESCIDLIRFTDSDVVRSKTVREVLKLYNN